MFIGRTDAEAETPILWPPNANNWLLKTPWCWEKLKMGGEGDYTGWDGWMASLAQWTWVCSWVDLGVGDGQGGLACCSLWGRKELDTIERLNWTELNWTELRLSEKLQALICFGFINEATGLERHGIQGCIRESYTKNGRKAVVLSFS